MLGLLGHDQEAQSSSVLSPMPVGRNLGGTLKKTKKKTDLSFLRWITNQMWSGRRSERDLFLVRAKSHIRAKEWTKAIACLNVLLTEPRNQPIGEDFIPDKEGLLVRGRVKLILSRNEEALADALLGLGGMDHADSLYPRLVALRADTLYQMGEYEHALMHYHRGNRVKKTDAFRMGIMQATDAIHTALKLVAKRIKENSAPDILEPSAAAVSQPSKYSRPPAKSRPASSRSGGKVPLYCVPSSNPFHRDIIDLKDIIQQLNSSALVVRSRRGAAAHRLASDALDYVRKRNTQWATRDPKALMAKERRQRRRRERKEEEEEARAAVEARIIEEAENDSDAETDDGGGGADRP